MRDLHGLGGRDQPPDTPTIPDLADRGPQSPLERLVALGFPEASARDALFDGDLDAAFATLSRARSEAQAKEEALSRAPRGNRKQRRAEGNARPGRRRRRRLSG